MRPGRSTAYAKACSTIRDQRRDIRPLASSPLLRNMDSPVVAFIHVPVGTPNPVAGMVRWAMRQALEADAVMLAEVKSVLASAQGTAVKQYVRAGRDAYVAGRDMTINRASK